MIDQIQNTLLLFALIFTSAGFVLGLFVNVRKVMRLEDKVMRLKRTVRHLQDKLEKDVPSEEPAPARRHANRADVGHRHA